MGLEQKPRFFGNEEVIVEGDPIIPSPPYETRTIGHEYQCESYEHDFFSSTKYGWFDAHVNVPLRELGIKRGVRV